MKALSPPKTFRAYDPYYKRQKHYATIPLAPFLRKAFKKTDAELRQSHFIFRAKDGYSVPLSGERLLEPGGAIAFRDMDKPGWEPIGPQKANPGPFYLVWQHPKQHNLATHPRPWQLAKIELDDFARRFPHTLVAKDNTDKHVEKGFRLFRQRCIRCHAINREGGRVGPDLNVPRSIIEYRPEAQIKAYIRNPRAFRYGNMPAHPDLSDQDLTDLLAYFGHMKSHKFDPDKGKPSDHLAGVFQVTQGRSGQGLRQPRHGCYACVRLHAMCLAAGR